MRKRLMYILQILEEEFSRLLEVEKTDVLPKDDVIEGKAIEGEVTEREVRKSWKRTRRISITRTERISKGSKEVLRSIGDLITSLASTPIPQCFQKLIVWILGRST